MPDALDNLLSSETEEARETSRLLREAATLTMSLEERKAQRVSFIMGMMSRKSNWTRRDVEKFVEERYG